MDCLHSFCIVGHYWIPTTKCFTVVIAEAHKKYGGMGTLLVNKVSAESANQFGELVADPETNELLHYTEKPETFVSAVLLFV